MFNLAAVVLAMSWSHAEFRYSEVSIVPPEPLPLGGYTERKDAAFVPGGDDLKARTEFISCDNRRIAVVSLEMLTVPESLHAAVRERLPKDWDLFITATHTHCAPDSQMLNDRMTFKIPGIATFRQRWLAWYADRIASGVKQAAKAPSASLITISMREKRMPLNRSRRPGMRADDLATRLTFTFDGELETNWFHYAAHPVIYDSDELHLRGDWPGAVASRCESLVLQGTLGDVSPNVDEGSPKDKIAIFTDAFYEFRNLPPTSILYKAGEIVRWSERRVALDRMAPHPSFAKTNRMPEALAKTLVAKFAPPSAKICAFRFGKLAVVGVPGEPTSDIGRQIKSYGISLGFRSVLVVSNVNGWIGYILTPQDYDKGGYEATLSFHGRLTGDRVVDSAKGCLKDLIERSGPECAGPNAGVTADLD